MAATLTHGLLEWIAYEGVALTPSLPAYFADHVLSSAQKEAKEVRKGKTFHFETSKFHFIRMSNPSIDVHSSSTFTPSVNVNDTVLVSDSKVILFFTYYLNIIYDKRGHINVLLPPAHAPTLSLSNHYSHMHVICVYTLITSLIPSLFTL
jgi:hypothetical protein